MEVGMLLATKSMTISEARTLLSVHERASKPEILSAFRNYVKNNHQDQSGVKVDMDVAVKAKQLLLANTASFEGISDPNPHLHTVDGVPLFKLGNGVPWPKSGKPCHDCQGRGFSWYTMQPEITCPACSGLGRSIVNYYKPCHRCKGTRTVRSALGGRRVYVKCQVCEGIGEIEIFNPLLPKGLLV